MISYDLKMEQKQRLIMTPELRQAIKLLQFSSLELAEHVNQALLENPLLEIKDEAEQQGPQSEEMEGGAYRESEEEAALSSLGKERTDRWEDWREYVREIGRGDSNLRYPWREEGEDFSLENIIPKKISLQEHLQFQLGCLRLSAREQEIGRYLIGNIDSAGYLGVSVEEAAKHLGAEKKLVELILRLLQGLEPAGVGARNLQECLLIQLKQKNMLGWDLEKLVSNFLPELGQGKFQKVAAALNLPVTRVQEMADQLRLLDPKPGTAYGCDEKIRYIIPDLVVERVGNEFVILLNDPLVPRLMINKTYRTILIGSGNPEIDRETKTFVENKMNQALWLIRSIEQRRLTIYRVAEALLKKQMAFFRKGIMHLRPLTMKEIADEIGMHESTVSRAVSHKYLQTPHGIFEMKFFFATGFSRSMGESTSAQSIKRLLSELVKKEEPTKPYSDQKLAEIMREQGIRIARRTIAKYREELGILSAGQRRRYE